MLNVTFVLDSGLPFPLTKLALNCDAFKYVVKFSAIIVGKTVMLNPISNPVSGSVAVRM